MGDLRQGGPPVDKGTLVTMLTQAAELEHALCVQYLYAAFTLKTAGDEGLSSSQASLTQQWEQQITKVALQEMYHLMIANNLLIAVGAKPNMWRPNFPQPNARYSDVDLPSVLAPFDLDTLSRFMCWEKPDTDGWWVQFCEKCSDRARTRYALEAAEPPPYDSIGQLYGSIKQALLDNPGWLDSPNEGAQVTSDLVPFQPPVGAVSDALQAGEYIDVIVEEGEGTPDWDSQSHFAYYHQIVDELTNLSQSDPEATMFAAWPTVDNPIYDPANSRPGTSLITDAAVSSVGVLLNEIYELLVTMFARLFAPNGETPAQRRSLANAALALMPLGIKPVATLLTRLPAGADYPGLNAGPSFELPPALTPPAGPANEALKTFHDSLLTAARRCRILSLDATALGGPALTQLEATAARLETLLPMLEPAAVRGGGPR